MERYRDTPNEGLVADQMETPLILDSDAYAIEFNQAISSLVKKTEPTAYERAQAEMRRRADDPSK